MATFNGTFNNDDFEGTGDDDQFFMELGGTDRVSGRGGGDLFAFGAQLDAADRIDGGAGIDTLALSGNYGGLVLAANTIKNVERLSIGSAGFDYDIAFHDKNVGAGKSLIVDGTILVAGDTLTIDSHTELDGNYDVTLDDANSILTLGFGNDTVSTGSGTNVLILLGGSDRLFGGTGADTVTCFGDGALDPLDQLNGGLGGGENVLVLSGDYSAGLKLKPLTLQNFARVDLTAGDDYRLDFSKMIADEIFINAGFLTGSNALHFTGGNFDTIVNAGEGVDTVRTGAGDDFIFTALGADTMIGGAGSDSYAYINVPESTGSSYDTIVGFNALEDLIRIPDEVDGVDAAITEGRLRSGNFNFDLEIAVSNEDLQDSFAVLFKPDTGSLAGEWFLIVDDNGDPGYQEDEDWVIHLDNPKKLGQLDLDNFIT
jgi:hypothetical protein